MHEMPTRIWFSSRCGKQTELNYFRHTHPFLCLYWTMTNNTKNQTYCLTFPSPSGTVCGSDLGVILDNMLSTETQINQVYRSASYHPRTIGSVRRYTWQHVLQSEWFVVWYIPGLTIAMLCLLFSHDPWPANYNAARFTRREHIILLCWLICTDYQCQPR